MKTFSAAIATLLMFGTTLPCSAQGLKDAKTTLKTGNWTVLRSTDTMTDRVSCTGIYKSNSGIQLVQDRMFVGIAGGIRSVTLRFGENPPQSLRLPQDIEKKVNSVIVEGAEFRQALDTTRLRVQVLTLVRGVTTEDLDTTGIQAAVEHIRAGCPLQADGGVGAKPSSTPESACLEPLIARLRAAGVSEQQIATACRL